MPELPEVETIVRDISPKMCGKKITHVVVHESNSSKKQILQNITLTSFKDSIVDSKVLNVCRRSRYILIRLDHGTVAINLGRSGNLIWTQRHKAALYEHAGIEFENNSWLRLRMFLPGSQIWWIEGNIEDWDKIAKIGPEPLDTEFNEEYLYGKCLKSKAKNIKIFLTTDRNVAGVGNIYATEALFLAGISPERKANKISEEECSKLVISIKKVLKDAIEDGGTTLEGFVRIDGKTRGQYSEKMQVYGRDSIPCCICGNKVIGKKVKNKRPVYYCEKCQK